MKSLKPTKKKKNRRKTNAYKAKHLQGVLADKCDCNYGRRNAHNEHG
jgi:hypothetical protein